MVLYWFVSHTVDPVLVTPLPVNLRVNEWSMVLLMCQFTGYPVPQVTWHSSTGTVSGVVTSNVTGDDMVVYFIICFAFFVPIFCTNHHITDY